MQKLLWKNPGFHLAFLSWGIGISCLYAQDFSLSSTPNSQAIPPGASTTFTVTVTASGGFTGTVSFSSSGLPTGASASFSPSTVAGSGSTTMTVTSATTTPNSSSTLTVTGTSGSLIHTTGVTLLIAPISYVYDDLGRLTTVTNPGGASAVYAYDAVGNLTSITTQTPVSIASFAPVSGPVGTTVNIFGAGFSPTSSLDSVTFNGSTATITSATSTQIVATVPTGATTGVISVTSPSGTTTTASSFTVTAAAGAPTISSFTPADGYPNSSVIITGTNFDPQATGNTVAFNGTAATVYSATTTTINAAVPLQATSGKITVQTAAGLATSSTDFFVASGFALSQIAFSGRATVGGSSVTFNLSAPNQVGIVLFDGTAGQNIFVLMNSSLSGANVVVISPDGTTLSVATVPVNGTLGYLPSLPATGTYSILVSPSSSSTGSVTISVATQITGNDFAIAALPNLPTAIASPTYTVYVCVGTTFSGTVGLSVSGLPTGASASFTSISADFTSVMTVTPGTAAAGAYTLTITGTSGSLTHTTTVTFNVNPIPSAWANQDIGSGATGTGTSYSNGAFTVSGSGTSAFQFVYQPMTGDGVISARLVNMVNGGAAGVAILETLTSGAQAASLYLAGGSASFATSGGYGPITLAAGVPYWLSLTRSGNNFAAYVSEDGAYWVQLGSTQTISMASTVYIGLSATSGASGVVSTATFDTVNVFDSTYSTPDFWVSTLPSITLNKGDVSYPKVFAFSDSGFTGSVSLSATGLPTGASASFSSSSVTPGAESVLTLTTSSTTPAGTYTVTITGTSGSLTHIATISLTVTGAAATLPSGWAAQNIGAGVPGVGSSYSNGAFTLSGSGCCLWSQDDSFQFAYQPMTGDGWVTARVASAVNPVGTAKGGVMIRQTLASDSPNAFIGLEAGTYGLDFQFRSSTLASTSQTSGPIVTGPYWVSLSRTGNNFTAYVSEDGANWVQYGTTQTIAMDTTVYVGLAATSETNGQITTVTFDTVAVGDSAYTADFWVSTEPTVTMNRSDVSYPKVFVVSDSGFTSSVSLSATGLPTGATASFSSSSVTPGAESILTVSTGSTTPAGTYPITITGTSGSLTHTATLTLTVLPAATTLPTGWANQDIGTGMVGTGSSYSGGTYTVSGTGCCIWSQSDSFQFAYQTISGSATIIAEVTGASNFIDTAKVGIMIRETLAADSTNVFVGLENTYGLDFQARFSTFGTTYQGTGSVGAPYWLKLVRSGSSFSAYSSTDGSTWTQFGSTITISMDTNAYIGLAVTSETNGQVTTGTFANVTITSP
jgi:YD repeat-containing protein